MRGLIPENIAAGFTVEYAALFFLILFIGITVRTYWPRNKNVFREIENLPFLDGTPIEETLATDSQQVSRSKNNE